MNPGPAGPGGQYASIGDLDLYFETRGSGPPLLVLHGSLMTIEPMDNDIVRLEHAVDMVHLLGGGIAGDLHGLPASRLSVIPGTTHEVAPRGLGRADDQGIPRLTTCPAHEDH